MLDTDVLLDLLLDRGPFANEAEAIWEANRQGQFEDYIAAIAPINIFYIVRKVEDATTARKSVEQVLSAFRVCPVNEAVLQTALLSPIKDFEDAVQHASAKASGLDAIVTRNLKDYSQATLTVFSPSDFLTNLSGSAGASGSTHP